MNDASPRIEASFKERAFRAVAVFGATVLLGGAIAFCGTSMAAQANEASLHGHAQTGAVGLSVETDGDGSSKIELGETYDRTYSIRGTGSDCYVRLDAHVEMDDLSTNLIQDGSMNEDWVLGDDGMWYYTHPLSKGEAAIFNGKLYYPVLTEWMEGLETGGDYRIKEVVTAHAIQVANMNVDFESSQPWGDITADDIVISSCSDMDDTAVER